MTALLALAVVVLALLLRRPSYQPHRPLTESELVEALLIARKRARRYERERAERMRGYARRWPAGGTQERGRSYALPFVVGGGR